MGSFYINGLEDAAELYSQGREVAIPIKEVAFFFAVPIPQLIAEGIELTIDPHEGVALVPYAGIVEWATRTGRRAVEATRA